MSYRGDAFRAYAAGVLQPNVVNTYASFVRRIDEAIGGLDEALAERGAAAVMQWAETTSEPPLATYRSSGKSALRRYLAFTENRPIGDADEISSELEQEALSEAVSAAFGLERTMQAAVRRPISNLEPGIRIVDDGLERVVATGKIDILARDAQGLLTVIELKAGQCPPGAIEQALGYAQSLSDEEGERTRTILVAFDFSDRQLAASRRIADLKLVKYDYTVTFSEVALR